MVNQDDLDTQVQQVYARWLDAVVRVTFTVTLAAFLLYVSGVLPAYVPLETLPQYWGLPVDEYLRRTGAPAGWAWLRLADRGDFLNLACMALIALATLVCYLRLLPLLVAQRQRLDAALAAAQILVLVLAASGWLSGGG
jgi:hypothetical protein